MKHTVLWLMFGCMLMAQEAIARDSTANKSNADTAICCKQCICDNNTSPLGISLDHVHEKGGWMLGYSYMNVGMSGAGAGTKKIGDDQVYQSYMMSPTDMQMHMTMFMLMYGITDRLTIMGMAGFVSNNMDMNMDQGATMPGMNMSGMPSSMNTYTSGLGDSRIGILYSLVANASMKITGGLSVNIPTGSVTENGTTLLGDNQRLSYMMQTGSGSWGIAPGMAFTHSTKHIDLGAQINALVNLNNNSQGYRFGNTIQADVWASYPVSTYLSLSLRASMAATGRISGQDAQVSIPINEAMDPTSDTHNYGGTALNLFAGFNLRLPHPLLKKIMLQAAYGIPGYQYLNGTQGRLQSTFLMGIKYTMR